MGTCGIETVPTFGGLAHTYIVRVGWQHKPLSKTEGSPVHVEYLVCLGDKYLMLRMNS